MKVSSAVPHIADFQPGCGRKFIFNPGKPVLREPKLAGMGIHTRWTPRDIRGGGWQGSGRWSVDARVTLVPIKCWRLRCDFHNLVNTLIAEIRTVRNAVPGVPPNRNKVNAVRAASHQFRGDLIGQTELWPKLVPIRIGFKRAVGMAEPGFGAG